MKITSRITLALSLLLLVSGYIFAMHTAPAEPHCGALERVVGECSKPW